MNGYTLMAETYKKAAEEGKITQEEAAKRIRIYEFLATCDTEDKQILYSSSAFNDFMRSEISITIDELKDEGTLTDKQAPIVRSRLYANMTE